MKIYYMAFYEFVQVESDSLNGALNQLYDIGLDIQITEELKPIKHIFTHLIWHIELYSGYVNEIVSPYEIINDLNKIPISTVLKNKFNNMFM